MVSRMIRLMTVVLLLVFTAPAEAQMVRDGRGVVPFNCTMISTATTLTEVTGCAVPVADASYYITSISWSSSIISTTTNFFLLRSGTGTNCATGTTSLYADFIPTAFASGGGSFQTPIKVTAGHAICFIHPGAGTRNVNIVGYLSR